ncbi:MAG: taurine dioxygenase [Acidobacteria bacterium]|nr:taurine dioxygenase [Acidobacteriota bacterium]
MKVERVSPALGAEIHHVALASVAEDDDLFAEIRALLLQHKVLFFRDQDLAPAAHVALGRRLGQLVTHPAMPTHPDHPELLMMYRDEQKRPPTNVWHTDGSFLAEPPAAFILRCVVSPEVGGDTMWANMALAYERLPADVKQRINGLYAKHSFEHIFGGDRSPADRARLREVNPMVEHPVVRTHPETNEKILYVNQEYTTHFSNFKSTTEMRYGSDFAFEASALMNYLIRQVEIPEFQVRLRWRPNTVAIWDNRSTQHYAIHDFYPAVRHMMRVAVLGDRPF